MNQHTAQHQGDLVASPTQHQAPAPAPQQTAAKPSSNAKRAPSRNPTDIDPTASRDAQDTTPLTSTQFYELIGMRAPEKDGTTPKSLEARHGLYSILRQRERLITRKYHAYDTFTTALLLAQLVLSALFIVLGALDLNHIAVAVLGAVSAVVAGVLALMKGQGLPNRLRMERDALRRVLFEADELYWDVGAGKSVTFADIKKVREAYLKVVQDAEKNHPDTWNTTATADAKGVEALGKNTSSAAANTSPKQILPRGLV